jgi:hypothetical protein
LVGSECERAAVTEDECLNGNNESDGECPQVRAEYDRGERTAGEVSTRPTGNRPVEHLCGEHGCSDDSEQLNPILG